jgi:hypothetical protein
MAFTEQLHATTSRSGTEAAMNDGAGSSPVISEFSTTPIPLSRDKYQSLPNARLLSLPDPGVEEAAEAVDEHKVAGVDRARAHARTVSGGSDGARGNGGFPPVPLACAARAATHGG